MIDTGKVKLENVYAYKVPGSGKTSLQVSNITKYDQSVVTYGYDVLGNVTSMVTSDGTYEYQYDYLNRLVREYNPVDNRTLIMSYTGNNNILAKKYYAGNQPLNVSGTPQEAYEYSYDTSWKDKLISVVKKVNGTTVDTQNFVYSSNFMGNPSQIGSKTLTWKGRRLTDVNSNIQYAYNEEGIRTSKTVDSIITTYELNGSNIVAETKDGVTTKYIYNERGLLVGFEYLNKVYYYVRDLLGTIIEVVDENGNVMVSYKYDAWGNIIDKSVTNVIIDEERELTVDDVNHFVYKGYYLDNETGWYYLKSRYYNSIISRFITVDHISFLEVGTIEKCNLFVYCANNPIMSQDADGNSWWKAALMIVGAVVVVAACAATMGAGAVIAGAALGLVGKYTEDVIFNAIDGKTGADIFKPSSRLDEYVAAGVMGAITGPLTMGKTATKATKIAAKVIDIVVRPAINQGYAAMSGSQEGFDPDKYFMDVGYRAAVSLISLGGVKTPKFEVFGKYIDNIPKYLSRAAIRKGKKDGDAPTRITDIIPITGG